MAFSRRRGIVFGLKEKRGRGVGNHGQFGRERIIVLGIDKESGINDYRKIRPTTELVGFVSGRVRTIVELTGGDSGQMTARGEAKDADAMRINFPFGGVKSGQAKSALGVLERGDIKFLIWAGGGNAVFEQHAGHADGIQPIANFRAFEVPGQNGITASGTNDDGRSGVFIRGRRKNGDRRRGNVRQTNDGFARDQVFARFGNVHFRAEVGNWAGRSLRPESDRLGGGDNDDRDKQEKTGEESHRSFQFEPAWHAKSIIGST